MQVVKLISEICTSHIDHATEALERRVNVALADGWALEGTQVTLSSDGSGGWICVFLATLAAEGDERGPEPYEPSDDSEDVDREPGEDSEVSREANKLRGQDVQAMADAFLARLGGQARESGD